MPLLHTLQLLLSDIDMFVGKLSCILTMQLDCTLFAIMSQINENKSEKFCCALYNCCSAIFMFLGKVFMHPSNTVFGVMSGIDENKSKIILCALRV